MKHHLPARKLREDPDLNQIKRQAKELLQAFLAGEANAVEEVNAHYRGADPSKFALHDAQLALARSYGFESWPKLKAYVDGVTIQRLGDAVRAGNLAEVRTMLKARPELANMEMSYGNEHRPLHYAVMNRSPEIVRLLMQHGADARCGIHPHRDATTALTMAIERGYDDIVAVIEEAEQSRRQATSASNVAVTSSQDDLNEAIANGDDARAIAMLEADSSLVHGCDREGWTPLHMASAVRRPKLVDWLLQHGAQANRRGKDARTPLDLAAGSRRPVQEERFAAVAGILRRAGAEMTARAAVALGDADWLRARHAEGALVNPITWGAGGLLTVAVKHNRPDMLALLLDFGFDPDERVSSGEGAAVAYSQGFPLWECAALGRREMAELLLERGANPNSHVDSSGSSVYSAYSHRQWDMVELLRRYGGVVGADTAAIYRQTDLARQMLADDARGALPEGTVSGRPLAVDLLDFAASGGDPEIVRMALERIDWPRDDERWFRFLARPIDFWNHIPWLYAGNKELDRSTYLTCFLLVLERCDPNVIGGFNRTVLHEVAAAGDHVTDEEVAPFAIALLDAGARTNVPDDILGSTPLGWACRWGRVSVAKALLEHGADPIEADAEPWARPRAWAEKMRHASLLTMLVEHGA
ncbi:MAG TPA: ankyrin repeat domain-containing protein [Bryobacteraceae bacterium]|nr:ankyrin repeat domain-containing protein [Bryobacteraceae bacterium]